MGLIYRGITIGLATEHQWQWNYEPGYWNGTYPDGNWVDGAGQTIDLDPIPYIIITILILHVPNLIMALITTIDKNNIKIIYKHPSLILLPCFTFFSFKKIKLCNGDGGVKFSKRMTLINIVLSTVSLGSTYGVLQTSNARTYYTFSVSVIPVFVGCIILTLIVLFMEECCKCFNAPTWFNIKNDIRIYDPSNADSARMMKYG